MFSAIFAGIRTLTLTAMCHLCKYYSDAAISPRQAGSAAFHRVATISATTWNPVSASVGITTSNVISIFDKVYNDIPQAILTRNDLVIFCGWNNFRTNLENLSIGLGEGLTNQLEGIKGMVTDPIGTAKGVYEAGKAVVRDPAIIASALRQMGQKAMSGPLNAGEVIGEMIGPRKGGPVMQELDVYHGTPHRFPATEANPLGEFDASKIGTGEGAQAFGHGIYLAEKPTVAQDYQFMLSKIDPNTTTYQGKPVEKWYEMAQTEQDRAHRLRDQKAIDRANAKLAFWENVMTRRHPEDAKRVANDPDDGWPTLANYANSLDMSKFGGIGEAGSLYKADLPDEMIDRMLDWDKCLKMLQVLESGGELDSDMDVTVLELRFDGKDNGIWIYSHSGDRSFFPCRCP